MKLSDYIAKKITESGIRHVFMITGGGSMHLNHSLGHHPKLECIFNHHEQACAMAAESYARLTGKIALVNVTTGPGGINALNGVFGAWTDSVPMLIISGQVRFDTTIASTSLPHLRQLGDQEVNIIEMIKPITKYAAMVTDPKKIKYHLERALYLARTGRPGPCWLDIPMNVQGSMVEESDLKSYDPLEDSPEYLTTIPKESILHVLDKIKTAKRPVLLAGSGIRSANAHASFLKLVELLKIPVVTAWNAHDNISNDHPYYFGRPNSVGDRAGNFIVQNSDLLLVLGSRLNIRQISYNWKSFAREAYKIMIDIDPNELSKPTIHSDFSICTDLSLFINDLIHECPAKGLDKKEEWLNWCRIRKERYPVVLKEYWDRKDLVNPYCFVEALSHNLAENQITVTGDGTACVCMFQASTIKKGQRLYTNSGSASMGYDLPAAIGACVGSNKNKIVCIAGDGSIQMNIQELQTIAYHRFPIKIFVLNNNGYHSIKQTQINFFDGQFVGCDPSSGLGFPEIKKIATAYEIPYRQIRTHAEMEKTIKETLLEDGPQICEVRMALDQPFAPRTSSMRLPDGRMVTKPLEDLAPFLDRKEFLENMIVTPLPE